MRLYLGQVDRNDVAPVLEILKGADRAQDDQNPQHQEVRRRFPFLVVPLAYRCHFTPFGKIRSIQDHSSEKQGSCPDGNGEITSFKNGQAPSKHLLDQNDWKEFPL